ncbi:hypothetical protein BC827DRAFT_1287015 [Russula dissimulans]|nr:hypothetical protein BC827DRAFT_1287015 [Russula dissimulans]
MPVTPDNFQNCAGHSSDASHSSNYNLALYSTLAINVGLFIRVFFFFGEQDLHTEELVQCMTRSGWPTVKQALRISLSIHGFSTTFGGSGSGDGVGDAGREEGFELGTQPAAQRWPHMWRCARDSMAGDDSVESVDSTRTSSTGINTSQLWVLQTKSMGLGSQ